MVSDSTAPQGKTGTSYFTKRRTSISSSIGYYSPSRDSERGGGEQTTPTNESDGVSRSMSYPSGELHSPASPAGECKVKTKRASYQEDGLPVASLLKRSVRRNTSTHTAMDRKGSREDNLASASDWESEAPERQDQYGGSIAQSVTSEMNIMDDEEKKKSKNKKKKKDRRKMDITRPSTLPCFPSFKFHVFVKNSDLIVIHPEAELYKRWSRWITILVVYNAISAPLRFAFTNSDASATVSSTSAGSMQLEFSVADLFETMVDLCFFTDVIIQFRLAYFVYGTLVVDPEKIAIRYFKMKFWTDLLATVPLDYFSPALRFTGLLRLIRMTRLLELFSQLEKNFEVNYIAICLTKFMTLLLVCSHWAGCGFFYLASQLDFNEHTWVGNVALPEGLLKDEPWTTQYVYSVYWAVTTLTTVGYGDISPEGIAERMFTMLVMLFNMGVTAYILGNMTLIATKSDAATAEFRTVMTSLSEVLHRKRIPQHLRDAALGQVQLSYDMQDERDDALKHCPPFVRNQILKFLYRRSIADNYLLHETTTTLVDSLTNFVHLEFFFPDTPLIDPFQMPDSLFFIMEGDVEMLDEGAVLRLLKTGDTFGEEAVLCNITTPLEYKSSSFCRVLLMPRAELQHVLEKSPAENRVMQNNVLTHLQSWIQEETDRFARAEVLQQTFVIEAPAPKPAFPQKRRSTTSYGSLTSLDDGEQDARNSSYLHASMWPEAGKVMTEEEAKAWDAEVALIERRMHASMELAQMVQAAITRGQQDLATRLCYLAMRDEKEGIRQILVDPSVDPNLADYDGRTPLHLAALHGHVDTVEYLIERGANPSVRDVFGTTPLWEATRKFHEPVMKLLLKYGAEIGLDDAAYTLCNASFKADAPLVRALCQSGVDVNTGDYDGRTCLHLAASDGVLVIVQILLEFKADVNVADRWNNTPLDDAKRGQHVAIVELLEGVGAKQGAQLLKEEEQGTREEKAKGQGGLSSLVEEPTSSSSSSLPRLKEVRMSTLRRSLDLVVRPESPSGEWSGEQTVGLDSPARSAEELSDDDQAAPAGRQSGEWVPALSAATWPQPTRSREFGEDEADGAAGGSTGGRSRAARFSRRTLM